MSHIAQPPGISAIATVPASRLGLWARARNHLACITAAHTRLARLSPQMAAISRDVGLPVEDVLGQPAYDAALPFFFQPGFDRH